MDSDLPGQGVRAERAVAWLSASQNEILVSVEKSGLVCNSAVNRSSSMAKWRFLRGPDLDPTEVRRKKREESPFRVRGANGEGWGRHWHSGFPSQAWGEHPLMHSVS
jgi:hypothetical protein